MNQLSWRVRRAALGIRQRDVANRAGISQARFSLLERGEATPTEAESDAVEKALNIPADVAKVLIAAGQKPRSNDHLSAKRGRRSHQCFLQR